MSPSTYRLVDGADELVLSGNGAESPIVVVDSEFVPPSARAVQYDRVGISGKQDLTRLHNESEFSATLKIQGDAYMTRYEYLEELKSFLSFTRRPYLYIQREGWLSERRCLLRGDGMSVVVGHTSGHWLDVAVRAILPNGSIEDNEASTVTLRSGSRNVGVSYPLSYPLGYETDTSANTFSVQVLGNDIAMPYIRIYGTCSDPQFVLTAPDGTIKYFSLNGATVPEGSYLDIDFVNRKVFLDGNVDNSYHGYVDFITSDWWGLEYGTNQLVFLSTAPSAGCYAEISYRNTYLP